MKNTHDIDGILKVKRENFKELIGDVVGTSQSLTTDFLCTHKENNVKTWGKPMLPRFYSVKEAAAFLNVSTKTVRRLLERGLLKSSKALRKKLIPCSELETFYQRTC